MEDLSRIQVKALNRWILIFHLYILVSVLVYNLTTIVVCHDEYIMVVFLSYSEHYHKVMKPGVGSSCSRGTEF